MSLITSQTARELAAKSHESRRRNNAERIAEAQREAQDSPPAEIAKGVSAHNVEAFRIVQAEIRRLGEMLESKLEPKDRAALVRALDDMIDRARCLRGEPAPGSYRPNGSSDARASILTAPVLSVRDHGHGQSRAEQE
jgi:hypothetical protein